MLFPYLGVVAAVGLGESKLTLRVTIKALTSSLSKINFEFKSLK